MNAMRFRVVLPLFAVTLIGLLGGAYAGDSPARSNPPIYDTAADGTKQITDALALAAKDNKRVLVQFGANWCGGCRSLHSLFESDKEISAFLQKNYVVVMIDTDNKKNKAVDLKYGNPTRYGLPVIVVLDPTGKQLTTKDSGELLEGDHHNPAKVLAFLKLWSPV